MRFDLRLVGRTADGKACQADVSVYANSADELQQEAVKASETAAWQLSEGDQEWLPHGLSITVENVELLGKPG